MTIEAERQKRRPLIGMRRPRRLACGNTKWTDIEMKVVVLCSMNTLFDLAF